MSDLIDRDAVMLRVREFIGNPTYDELMFVNDLNALPSAEPERIIKFDIGRRSGKTLESAIDYLQSTGWLQEHDRILTESAEPERKKGKWVDEPYKTWSAHLIRHCSNCGWQIHKSHLRNSDLHWNYCPNCGAKMEETK